MGRKQYRQIAAILTTVSDLPERARLAREFADFCMLNHRDTGYGPFRRETFYVACGLDQTGKPPAAAPVPVTGLRTSLA